jgi:hypothetical protein
MISKQYCTDCVELARGGLDIPVNTIPYRLWAVLQPDLVLLAKCPKGHTLTNIIVSPKFSVWFDLGVMACIDGYYREAVSHFATSLERLQEYYIRAVCYERKIETDAFEPAWKLVSSKPERELGAFCFLHLLELKKPPTLISDKLTKLRTAVVHSLPSVGCRGNFQ